MSLFDRCDLDLFDDSDDIMDMDLTDFLEPSKSNENVPTDLPLFDDHESNASDYSKNQAASTILAMSGQVPDERLRMVEQPYQSSKLRYRADYIREKRRIGALANKSNGSKLKGPVINIPSCYLNPKDNYFIRVSLVTIKDSKRNAHYFHPYELEHPRSIHQFCWVSY